MRLFRLTRCFKIQRAAQCKNHEPRQTKWQTTKVSTSGVVCFCVDFPCFLMHSSQKTTQPRDILHLFYDHILVVKTTSLHRNGRPLAPVSVLLGNFLYFVTFNLLFCRRVSASQNCGAATSVDAPTYVRTHLLLRSKSSMMS